MWMKAAALTLWGADLSEEDLGPGSDLLLLATADTKKEKLVRKLDVLNQHLIFKMQHSSYDEQPSRGFFRVSYSGNISHR